MKRPDLKRIFSTPFDNPLVRRPPITYRNNEVLTIIYRTKLEYIERILPPPLETVSEYVAVHFYKVNDADVFGVYHESAIQVECILPQKNKQGVYSPYLYLASDGAVAFGREMYGQPKKMGDLSVEVVGDLIVGRVKRNGIEILTGTLPYKTERSSFEEVAEYMNFKTNINLKVVPNIDGTPAIKQLAARTFVDVHIREVWKGPGTIEIRPNAQAPVYNLPAKEFVIGFYWIGDFTLPYGEVIYDYLKEE